MKILKALTSFIKPLNTDPEKRLRELVLNTLLGLSIGGFSIINIIRINDIITQPIDRGIPIIYTLIILGFFILLLYLSRRGWIGVSAWLLILIYSVPMFYSFTVWGADLPAALLLAVLVITMSGILIGEQLVLISTLLISVFLIILTNLHQSGHWSVASYWRQEPHEVNDSIVYSILLLVIAATAYFFVHGIIIALKRANVSEQALRIERDNLEQTLITRTNQLRQAHAEKLGQLYRLASFGRLSSGIFHDLMNPLTAISLNLEQVKGETNNTIGSTKSYLQQAILAANKMSGLIAGIKKQIQADNLEKIFYPGEEIFDIVDILSFKARRAGVTIIIKADKKIILSGCPAKFGQIVMNLLANAIEASEKTNPQEKNKIQKKIFISLTLSGEKITIVVEDNGCGIAPDILPHVFEPFYSTKIKLTGSEATGNNLGLGLSSVKDVVENHFKGQISVTSLLDQGTKFSVMLPIKINHHESI